MSNFNPPGRAPPCTTLINDGLNPSSAISENEAVYCTKTSRAVQKIKDG